MRNFTTALIIVRELCLFFLLMTTFFFALVFSFGFYEKYLSWFVVVICLTFISAALLTAILDGGFSLLLEVSVKTWFGKANDLIIAKYKRAFVALITMAALFFGLGTASITFLGSDTMAAAAHSETDTQQFSTTIKEGQEFYRSRVATLEGQLSKAQSSERQRVRAAKAAGSRKIKEAYNSGSLWQKKSWNDRRAWLLGLPDNSRKYKSNVIFRNGMLAAIADSTAAVDAELLVAAELGEKLTTLLTTGAGTTERITDTLTATIAMIKQRDAALVAAKAHGIVIGDIICFIMAWVTTFILAMTKEDSSRRIGKYSPARVLSDVGFTAQQRFLAFVNTWLTATDMSKLQLENASGQNRTDLDVYELSLEDALLIRTLSGQSGHLPQFRTHLDKNGPAAAPETRVRREVQAKEPGIPQKPDTLPNRPKVSDAEASKVVANLKRKCEQQWERSITNATENGRISSKARFRKTVGELKKYGVQVSIGKQTYGATVERKVKGKKPKTYKVQIKKLIFR